MAGPSGESCGGCYFFASPQKQVIAGHKVTVGFCVKYAPRAIAQDVITWANVADVAWCGEYKPAKEQE